MVKQADNNNKKMVMAEEVGSEEKNIMTYFTQHLQQWTWWLFAHNNGSVERFRCVLWSSKYSSQDNKKDREKQRKSCKEWKFAEIW